MRSEDQRSEKAVGPNAVERVVDWFVFAWLGAALTIMVIPVVFLIIAFKVADCLDEKLGWDGGSQD